MLIQIKAVEEVIIEARRRWPLAKPLAQIHQAQKIASSLRIKAKLVDVNYPGRWSPFKRCALVKSLTLVNRLCTVLSTKLATVEKVVVAPALEHHFQVIQQNK